MSFIKEFISEYGVTIVYAALTAIAGYIGLCVKNLYAKYVQNKEVQKAIETAVKAAEQIHKDLHGDEKLAEAVEIASNILGTKGINITSYELMMLIEATVNEFNSTVWSDKNK